MAVALTTSDMEGIERGMRELLSPLDHPTTDAWRGAVNRVLKPVLGADLATFYLPGVTAEPLYSDDIDAAALGEYPERERRNDRRFGIWRRMEELRVWTRPLLYGRNLAELRRSAYWNEYIVEIRGFDALGASVRLPAMSRPGALFFHHERPNGRRFGERGYTLLRLAYAALEAGLRMHVRLVRRREELARVLDAVPEALMLVRADGTVSHRNRALRGLLTADPEARRVRTALERTAAAVVALAGLDGGSGAVGAASGGGRSGKAGNVVDDRIAEGSAVSRTVQTHRAVYRIVGVLAHPSLFDRGPTVLVSAIPSRPSLPSAQAIRERHGLTPRESEVALLVARRRTNAEIAEALSISPHTARHHTERLMRTLGVDSRFDVEGVILGGADGAEA